MPYGPIPPKKQPKQDADLSHLMAQRFNLSASAHEKWALKAKECVDFLEDRQWSDADIAALEAEGRTPITLNKIKPIFTLAMGFHAENPVEIDYLPGHDGTGPETTAKVLKQLSKQIDEANSTTYLDDEQIQDGFTTGRGWMDTRIGFENNDLGEVVERTDDPFSVYVDPDMYSYDVNALAGGANYVFESRWVSTEEIKAEFNAKIADQATRVFGNQRIRGLPGPFIEQTEEVAPPRGMGGEFGDESPRYSEVFFDFIDTYRKTVRLIDMQHKKRVKRRYFIDMNTGDRIAVPEHFTRQKIEKTIAWSAQNGLQLQIVERMGWRIRWSIMAADVMLYDEWSPYETYTKTLFAPYFRRGETRGLIHSLIDPQKGINKAATAELNMLSRGGNTGWQWEEGVLSPDEEDNLKMNGGAAGVNIKYNTQGQTLDAPKRIDPAMVPQGWAQQRAKAADDLKAISLMNDAAQGQEDNAKSGRAIQARQKQAVIGLSQSFRNYARTKELVGMRRLELIQRHYTEARLFRIRGDSGKSNEIRINDRQADGTILNNVTAGKYQVITDIAPASASFMAAQFDEVMQMLETGIITAAEADLIIDLSSLPRKEEFKERVANRLRAMGIPVDGAPQQQPGQGLPGPNGQPPQPLEGNQPAQNVVPIGAPAR